MAQPTAYTRQYSATNHSTNYPTTPQPGVSLDAEFNAIKTSITETLTNLALIQRDDGELANDSVGIDQLAPDVDIGFASIDDWATATAYVLRDGRWKDTVLYRCIVAHTSGTFSTDLTAGYWEEVLDLATPLAAAVASATAAALAAQTAAELAEAHAETAETNAETAETNAATSATNASTSASTASTHASTASTQATNAAASAAAAAASAASIPSAAFALDATASITGTAGHQKVVDCSAAAKTYVLPASPSTSDAGIMLKKVGLYTLTIDPGGKKLQLPDGTFSTGAAYTVDGAFSGTMRFNYVGTIADGTTNVWSVG